MGTGNGDGTSGGVGHSLREFGLYYPGAIWTSGEWIKTLLLFFDGVALLTRDAAHADDPSTVVDMTIAEPLLNRDLLRILYPEVLVDEGMGNRLRAALQDPASWQALDAVGRDPEFYYGRYVYSTLNGPEPSIEMMEMRNELLLKAGAGYAVRELGRPGPSVPIHARLWAPVLSVVSQVLRPGGFRLGLDLQPVTDQPPSASALRRLLALPGMPSSRRVVALDVEQVALDLAPVPLDEVLQFREEHGERYRDYARNLRRIVRELSLLNGGNQPQMLLDRREELAEVASKLRRLTRSWSLRPLPTFGLGMVGAAWPDSPTASLRSLAGVVGTEREGQTSDAYSYLFTRQPRLSE